MKNPFRWLMVIFSLVLLCLPVLGQEQIPDLSEYDRDTLMVLCRQLYQRIDMIKQQVDKVKVEMDSVRSELERMRQLNLDLAEENSLLRQENDEMNNKLSPQPKSPQIDEKPIIGLGHVEIGKLTVSVTGAEIKTVELVNQITGAIRESKQAKLVLSIAIYNNDQDKEFEYRTWAGECFDKSQTLAELSDNLGNAYQRMTFGVANIPLGRMDSGNVAVGDKLEDVLIFREPYPFADYLLLKLPGSNLGQSGMHEIKIPMKKVERL